ncbi:MAG TPA: NEW3 domain-containing protein [Cyclobacteriaceae bacterium]|nr:NEW3 domain-containing protein [Cyclobacteriaceae bacterium]
MNYIFMPMRTAIAIMLISLMGLVLPGGHAVAESGVTLYTPYTKIAVPPGQSVDYTIDVINNGTGVKNVDISLSGVPKNWSYELKSGGWTIKELSVLPKEKKNLSLKVEVPMKVDKGTYHFNVIAPGIATLPLTVIVSEQGTYKTEFSTRQSNMQGSSNASFTYNADLKNRTGEKQLYSLLADTPPGWNVAFKTSGKQVSSVQLDPGRTENITVEVDPPDAVGAGSYKIPVTATTATTSADLELEVVVTGSYAMELTTPTGLLSTNIVAGGDKRIALLVRNNGSAQLKNIKLTSSAPMNWEVVFDPRQIERLDPGKSEEIFATIKADKKAIAGDYVTNLEARTPEVSSKTTFRVSVKTSMLYGWIGVLIIGGAIGGVYSLFRKYGRR